MTTFMDLSRKFLRIIGLIEMYLAAAMLVGIVLMILYQVLLNAGLGNPLTWEQEAGAYGLVWMTFLGASIALKQDRHVKILSFVSMLSVRWAAMLKLLALLFLLWVLYMVLGELGGVARIEGRAITVALPIDLPRSYFFSVPLYVACCSMSLTAIFGTIEQIYKLAIGKDAPGQVTSNETGLVKVSM